MHTHPTQAPQQISCEFIPFPDYGGGGRYAYYDTVPDLGLMIELLEFDRDKAPQP